MRPSFGIIAVLAVIAAPVLADEKAGSTPEGQALADKVQQFYERTADFAADFQQSYRYKAVERVQQSSGKVKVKKPGFMRWDYEKPYPKMFVLDGKALYAFDPDDNSVLVNRKFAKDSLSSAVTFLWGKGKLSDEFDVRQVTKPDYGPVVLQLTPRKPDSFAQLYFVVEPASGQVIMSVVFDNEGNENRITFLNSKSNTGMAQSLFTFKIPKGAQVKEL